MREWILYNTEIGTHALKKGYEPMLTMVTKGSMTMLEGDFIGDCSLVIWIYQMEVNKTAIMVENKSFSWMRKLWNFEWIECFITRFGEILLWMITTFFTSSYLWSPFWLHNFFLKKNVCNDYLAYLQVGSYFHTMVYVIVYLAYLLAYVAS
jgi:hypothetical protein